MPLSFAKASFNAVSTNVAETGVTSVGASLTEYDTTEVSASTTVGAMPSLTLTANVVVSDAPGTTRFAVGVKTKPRSAACAATAEPLNV